MKVPFKYKKLVSDILNKAELKNIKITISKEKDIPYPISNSPVSGFFVINGRYPNGELGIATGEDFTEWIKVLIHESCHIDQFLEQDFNWTNNFIYDCKDNKIKESIDLLEEWTDGRDFSKSIIKDLIDSCLNIELDCEIRAIKKIKKYNLDIDIENYIKQANSYIYFYRFLENYKTWFTICPHYIKKIWTKMPSHFDNDYSTVPEEYKKLFKTII